MSSAVCMSLAVTLNEPDDDERNKLTLKWKDQLQSQLNVILITSALIASVVASSFTWPDFELSTSRLGMVLTIVKALWYGSLLFSIVAIASAAQLAIALSRIAAYSTDLKFTRGMLTSHDPKDPAKTTTRVNFKKLWMWQIPAMLLNGSIYLYVLGLAILVYQGARNLVVQQVQGEATTILVIFTLALIWSIGNYLFSSAGLYHWVGQACEVRDRPPSLGNRRRPV
ncbi:hypothetical protein QBC37DRAFT_168986 [Rhypophila decipiens]|uniref:Uncharacterized protein n=1 Tax=Rhypophila decipiens TaxID=261697 RepID=A0AAN6Y6Y6_9PEZI|nr:hypothetical protein QBC37DRAFT_168986 [Rhypophila decipiens]